MRTTQNVLQWEQRPLQGSAPGSCSPAREGKRRPSRCHRSLGRCWRHGRCRVAVPSVGKARPGAWARSRAPRRRAPWDAGGEDAPVRGAPCRGGRAGLRGGTGALGSRGWLCPGGLRCCGRGRGPQAPGGGFVLGALWLCPSCCWGAAEGRSRTPSGLPAGPFGGKEGSRRRRAAPLWLPRGSAPQGRGPHLPGQGAPRPEAVCGRRWGPGGPLGSCPCSPAGPGPGWSGLHVSGGRGCEGRLEQVLSGSGAVAVPGLESLCAAAAPGSSSSALPRFSSCSLWLQLQVGGFCPGSWRAPVLAAPAPAPFWLQLLFISSSTGCFSSVSSSCLLKRSWLLTRS
ncbi:uncharacterized protein [Ciconia boyciana]|uniref:uncharacterized protein isoform X2 n=1 Tax=Ciconia boyciana TaxID=52775 RepID=UPI003B9E43E7